MCTSTRHFIRHYLEMIAAMIAGMVVLGIPAEGALHLIGSSTPQSRTTPLRSRCSGWRRS
jgi:hypothetical protein